MSMLGGGQATPSIVKEVAEGASLRDSKSVDLCGRLEVAQNEVRRQVAERVLRQQANSKQYMSADQVAKITVGIQMMAGDKPELALMLADAAAPRVAPDWRGLHFWDYTSISRFRLNRHQDAYLGYNAAVRAEPAPKPKPTPPPLAATESAPQTLACETGSGNDKTAAEPAEKSTLKMAANATATIAANSATAQATAPAPAAITAVTTAVSGSLKPAVSKLPKRTRAREAKPVDATSENASLEPVAAAASGLTAARDVTSQSDGKADSAAKVDANKPPEPKNPQSKMPARKRNAKRRAAGQSVPNSAPPEDVTAGKPDLVANARVDETATGIAVLDTTTDKTNAETPPRLLKPDKPKGKRKQNAGGGGGAASIKERSNCAAAAGTAAGTSEESTKRAAEAKAAEDKESDEAGSGALAARWERADFSNLAHVRGNMLYALAELRKTIRVGDVPSAMLPTLAGLLAKRRGATSESVSSVLSIAPWFTQSMPKGYHAFNPSIIRHPTEEGKFLVNLRAGNYTMTNAYRYEHPGFEGVHTRNFIGTIPDTFEGGDLGEMRELKAPPMPHPYKHIAGQEDIRLLWDPVLKRLYGSFTSLEMTPEHRPQMCLMNIDLKRCRVIGAPVRMYGLESDKPQKNWLSLAEAGHVFFMHSIEPVTVVQANPNTGEVRIVSVDATPVLNDWRGSSSLVDLPAELVDTLPRVADYGSPVHGPNERWFIALVHVSRFPQYCHSFVVMKKTNTRHSEFRPFHFQITHQSPPWTFIRHDVEFSCGMAFTRDLSRVLIPFSRRDNDCACATVNTKALLDCLIAIPPISAYPTHPA
jgi:hypothetical protein